MIDPCLKAHRCLSDEHLVELAELVAPDADDEANTTFNVYANELGRIVAAATPKSRVSTRDLRAHSRPSGLNSLKSLTDVSSKPVAPYRTSSGP